MNVFLVIEIPQVELVAINSLSVDQDNPNHMTDRQRKALAENLKRYGFIIPIVVNQDGLIADGQQRWEVAQSLGMKQVPIVRLPVSDVDRRILRQVLNKLRGEHLLDLDAKEFLKIIDAGERDSLQKLSAISDREIQRSIIELQSLPMDQEDFKFYEDTDVVLGDLYQLGSHKVMCGDSTNSEHVKKLFGEEKVDCLFTDPPYGIYGDFDHSLRNRKETSNPTVYHDIDQKDYDQFTHNWLGNVPFADYNTIYIWSNEACMRNLLNGAYSVGVNLNHSIIWVKQHFVLASIDYKAQHEICVYGWKGKHKFYGKDKSSIIMYDRPMKSPLHPTMKPVKLCEMIIPDGSLEGQIVYDPFGGSGSTLIACEDLGRSCRMMELEPPFVQTIVNRWEKHTGKKAEKLG